MKSPLFGIFCIGFLYGLAFGVAGIGCQTPAILGGPPARPCGWGVPYGDAGACCATNHGYVLTMYGNCEYQPPDPAPSDIGAKKKDAGAR